YRTLIETSPNAIVLQDLDGTVRLANRQAATLVGEDGPEALLGAPAMRWIVPQDRGVAMDGLRRTLNGETVRDVEVRLTRRDGSEIVTLFNGTTVRDAEGQPVGVLVMAHDVTQLKRAEDEQRRAHDRLSAILSAAADGITVQDESGSLVYVNQ